MDSDLTPIMAEFGAAVLDAQVLESSLSLLMFLTEKYQGTSYPENARDAFAGGQVERSVGALFKAVLRKEYFTNVEKRKINLAIQTRNELIHGFMANRCGEAIHPEGRAKILQELGKIRRQLQQACQIMETLIDKYLEEQGVSMEQIRNELNRQWVKDES